MSQTPSSFLPTVIDGRARKAPGRGEGYRLRSGTAQLLPALSAHAPVAKVGRGNCARAFLNRCARNVFVLHSAERDVCWRAYKPVFSDLLDQFPASHSAKICEELRRCLPHAANSAKRRVPLARTAERTASAATSASAARRPLKPPMRASALPTEESVIALKDPVPASELAGSIFPFCTVTIFNLCEIIFNHVSPELQSTEFWKDSTSAKNVTD
ncbi:uncharacterized protein LOC134538776 [Bacillus rossius redtenbacheri]|uniref:uncharacterized protein LOC134538776 n=1 Tax=Bacillus rossius redtenbacheri TaxID=93214 RepID=UPI002FDE299F